MWTAGFKRFKIEFFGENSIFLCFANKNRTSNTCRNEGDLIVIEIKPFKKNFYSFFADYSAAR